MTGPVDLNVELGGVLGNGGEWTWDEIAEHLEPRRQAAWAAIEGSFGRAGHKPTSRRPASRLARS